VGAQERPAEGAVRRHDLEVGPAAFLAGAEQHRLGVVVALVTDLQDHAGRRRVGVGGRDADLGGAQLADAGLLLALLLARGVVAAVLLEVALLAAGVDLGCNDRAVRDQLVEFLLEPIVGILGQPGRLGIRHGHHSSSLSGVHATHGPLRPRPRPPRRAARFEGGKAPSKEKHDPPAGRVMSTVTRGLPLVAAFRRTVSRPQEFPGRTSVLVKALRARPHEDGSCAVRAHRGRPS
jgi:hypothetical protein